MENQMLCTVCKISLQEFELITHAELHVGMKTMDNVQLKCGTCSFQINENDFLVLIKHFAITGHNMNLLTTNWKEIMNREENRLKAIAKLSISNWTQTKDSHPFKRSNPVATFPKITDEEELQIVFEKNDQKQISYTDLAAIEDMCPFITKPREEQLEMISQSEQSWKKKRKNSEILSEIDKNSIEKLELMKFNQDESIFKDCKANLKKEQQLPSDLEKIDENPKNIVSKICREQMKNAYCSFCKKSFGHSVERIRSRCYIHALRHNKSLFPYKCAGCEFRSVTLCAIRQHGKNSDDCGVHINLLDAELIGKSKLHVQQTFPEIEWEEYFRKKAVRFQIIDTDSVSKVDEISPFVAKPTEEQVGLKNIAGRSNQNKADNSETELSRNKDSILGSITSNDSLNDFEETPGEPFSEPKQKEPKNFEENYKKKTKKCGRKMINAYCTVCKRNFEYIADRIKGKCYEHAVRHKKSLCPYKCGGCEFRSPSPNKIRGHNQNVEGCGVIVNLLDAEMIRNSQLYLQQTFPEIEWDEYFRKKAIYFGVNMM